MFKNNALLFACMVVVMIGAYLRLDFIRSVNHEMSPDAINYTKMAEQLVEEGIYGYNSENPNAYVTPGYPVFLALSYKLSKQLHVNPWALVRYIQVLLSLHILCLIVYITYKLSNSYIPALTAAAVGAVYPPFIWANGAILTEVLCTFFLLGYVAWLIYHGEQRKKAHAFIAGILLGLTVLVRPEFFPIIFIVHAVYWFQKHRRSAAVSFAYSLLGVVLVLLPWWIRNYITLDEFIPFATQTNPFYAGTFPYNNYNDGMVESEGKTEMEAAIERLKVGFTQHTGLFVWWYTLGKLKYTYSAMYYGGGHDPFYPVLSSGQLLHRAIIWSGTLALMASLWFWRQGTALISAVIVLMSFIRLFFVPEYRYNFTMMPFFIILGSTVGYLLIKWLIRSSKARIPVKEFR
jgi:4-amino-4-deoxy-L-arabinose transferase-like glycosyltransferase